MCRASPLVLYDPFACRFLRLQVTKATNHTKGIQHMSELANHGFIAILSVCFGIFGAWRYLD